MMESEIEGLEIREHRGEGYRRLIDGPKWTVAVLNYADRFDEAKFDTLERHLLTDETFVLLTGEATLLIGADARRVPLEPLKAYNVKAGVWHQILVKPGTSVLIAENSDTAKTNSEYLDFRTTSGRKGK